MRILVVAPWVPSPQRPRSLGLIEALAREHEVHLIAMTWGRQDRTDLAQIKVASLREVRASRALANVRAALGVLGRRSLQQAYTDSPKMRKAISDEVRRLRPDVCYFNVFRSAHFVDAAKGCRAIIDLDEFRSAYYEQLGRISSNPVWRWIGRQEARRMAYAERAILQRFDRILVSSPTDVTRSERCVLVRSPHVLGRASTAEEAVSLPGTPLIFVGRLSYRANVEAVTWFVEKVLPQVIERVPDTVLYVVGAGPGPAVRKLAGRHVRIVGDVPNVKPYYSAADVSIVPVTMATGVQMKLIESLVMGVPTVATSLTADQAGVVVDVDCLVADSPDEWVTAVTRLLTDGQARADVSRAGKRWASHNYSHARIHAALFGALGVSD